MKINQFAMVHAAVQKVVQKTNLKYAEVPQNFFIMLGVVILLSYHRQGFTKENQDVTRPGSLWISDQRVED